MAEDPFHLHQNYAEDLAALRDLNAPKLLNGHHIGAVVDEGGQVIHAIRERYDLVPGAVLTELLEGRVQVADVWNYPKHGFPIEFAHEAEHTVSGRVLRADVDQHVLRADLGFGQIHGKRGA